MQALPRTIKNLIATAVLLGASVAHATDYFIPNLLESYPDPGFASNAVTFGASPSPFSFTDNWYFTIGTNGDFSGAVAAANVSSSFIDNFNLTLYSVADPTFSVSGQDSISNALLTSTGDYFIRVSGDVSGTRGGTYYLFANLTSAVPEPSELAMMMAGLSLIGFRIAKKRKV